MQHNCSFDSYLRTYPGADGILMVNGVPTICIPDSHGHPCPRPFVDHADVNRGGPHKEWNASADIDNGHMDGFICEARNAAKRRASRSILQT